MPNEIRYTPTALGDGESIHDYILRESRSERIADGLLQRIQSTAGTFATQPNAGSACSRLFRDGRYFVVGNYAVFYRPLADAIEIFRVIHGAQDIDGMFRRLKNP